MESITFDDLSKAELDDLKLCGITAAAQLENRTPGSVLHDLEQAQRFFPDHDFAITEERLTALCGQEDEETIDDSEEEDSVFPEGPEHATPTVQFKRKKNLREEILRERQAEEDIRKRRNSNISAMGKLERMHGLSTHFHAIHCSHPHRVYFGAWFTLLLIVPFCGLIIVPFMLLTDGLGMVTPLLLGVAFALTVLPWLLVARGTQCGVCHMPLFSFKNYPHHRTAHHLPLVGYTFTTALHIITMFWFRCPACGTQMKLFGRNRHSGHRHHR